MITEVTDKLGVRESTQVFPKDDTYEISRNERSSLEKLCEKLSSPKLYEIDSTKFLDQAAIIADEIPVKIREFVRNFRNYSNDCGAILIKGLPQEVNLQPTPLDDGIFGEKQISNAEKSHMMIMSKLGEGRGYSEEKFALILQNIYAVLNHEYRQENTGSLTELLGHTEDGFMKNRCDFLSLGCLRQDHHKVARTGVASSWQAIHKVSGKTIEVLRKPWFKVKVPSSFLKNLNEESWSDAMPVLVGDFMFPEMCVDFDAMIGINSFAQKALEEFGEALKLVSVSVALEAGDLLIIDNKVSMHFRTSFKPKYDGKDRWLQRMKVVINPRASQDNRKCGSNVVGSIALEINDLGLMT